MHLHVYICSIRHARDQPILTELIRFQIISLLPNLTASYLALLAGFPATLLSVRKACFYTLSFTGWGALSVRLLMMLRKQYTSPFPAPLVCFVGKLSYK